MMLRTGAALVLLACLTSPRPAAAEERHALVVSGVSGSEKFAESQKTWVSTLRTTLEQRMGFGADRITVLSEGGAGAAVANRENVMRTLASFKSRMTADDTLLVVLIGHGTYDGTIAKFNLVGPDMDSSEWKASLDGNPARLVFVNTTSSSFQFLPALSGKNRIIGVYADPVGQLHQYQKWRDTRYLYTRGLIVYRKRNPSKPGYRPDISVCSYHWRHLRKCFWIYQ
jgi:hypothetical protein